MNPLQKRNNPFATRIDNSEPKKVEEKVVEEKKVEEIPDSKPVQQKKSAKKPIIEQTNDYNKVKYTSTMDKSVRRAIKILCAERGILFASFVEDACREKLHREGVL